MAKRHPNKEIQAAINEAIEHGWRLESQAVRLMRGVASTVLSVTFGQRGGYIMSVYSTPASPRQHADQIRRTVRRCDH